jgi:ABC-2 type transport system permease protein
MAAIEAGPSDARRAATVRLLGKQVGYQLKLLARSPMAAFATLVIPLMVLLAVNLLYSGTRLSSRGGIPFAQFFTPAMVAFAVVNACYMSVISSTTLARDEGILKRIRGTPLPPWVYMTGRIVSSGLVASVGAVVVLAVGAGVYGFEVVWAGVPAALLTLAVAMFCFCSLGLAVTVLVPAADSAVPIAWGRCCRCASSPTSSSQSTTPRTGCARSRRSFRFVRSPTTWSRHSIRSPGAARSIRPIWS